MAGIVGPIPDTGRHTTVTRSDVSGLAALWRAWHSAARAARLRTTLGTIRAATGTVIAASALLAALVAAAFSEVASSLSAMDGTDAPEVAAATGLYFSLNDMDAQVANVLLADTDPALAAARPEYLATYARDREAAYADLQQAAVTAAGNAAAERQLRTVLDDVGQYEALAADALLACQQPPGTVGTRSPAPRPSARRPRRSATTGRRRT